MTELYICDVDILSPATAVLVQKVWAIICVSVT
jgi:hypothetical protein